jgi:hypothetical protein
MAVYVYNHSIQEPEAVGPWVQGQASLYSEFQASLGYEARSCLKKKNVYEVHISYVSFNMKILEELKKGLLRYIRNALEMFLPE